MPRPRSDGDRTAEATAGADADRFRLTVAEPAAPGADLAAEVARGLSAERKSIPCRFFYDATGSRLFQEICELPEYYLTRAEDEILARAALEIVGTLPPDAFLAELGSGDGRKTRRLIEAALARTKALLYMPIDISRSALEACARGILAEYPTVSVHAVAAEYEDGLRLLAQETDRPKLVLWLGSNVGNLGRRAAGEFLGRLAASLGARDKLLIGIDLRKSPAILEPAYDDAAGITARFNLHVLERINAELDGDFDLAAFRHVALYEPAQGRIEMHLESRVDQTVRIGKLDRRFALRAGERIHTEDSYKYSLAEIDDLARAAGMRPERRWLDRAERFSLDLFGV